MASDLRKQLRDADPLNGEPRLSPAVVQAMRRRIVSHAHAPAPQRRRFMLAAAMAVACVLVTVVVMRSRFISDDVAVTAPESGERRQLQFETPGGTRIIWVLNPSLEL